MKNTSITHPHPGETVWDKQFPPRDAASKLAHEHWDVSALHGPDENGVYAVITRSGYCANIGNIGGKLAILNRETDGSRMLIVYTGSECPVYGKPPFHCSHGNFEEMEEIEAF